MTGHLTAGTQLAAFFNVLLEAASLLGIKQVGAEHKLLVIQYAVAVGICPEIQPEDPAA